MVPSEPELIGAMFNHDPRLDQFVPEAAITGRHRSGASPRQSTLQDDEAPGIIDSLGINAVLSVEVVAAAIVAAANAERSGTNCSRLCALLPKGSEFVQLVEKVHADQREQEQRVIEVSFHFSLVRLAKTSWLVDH